MKVEDEVIINSLAEYYHNNASGLDLSSEFAVERFSRVKRLLQELDSKGISDLDILKIAANALETQTIKNFK